MKPEGMVSVGFALGRADYAPDGERIWGRRREHLRRDCGRAGGKIAVLRLGCDQGGVETSQGAEWLDEGSGEGTRQRRTLGSG